MLKNEEIEKLEVSNEVNEEISNKVTTDSEEKGVITEKNSKLKADEENPENELEEIELSNKKETVSDKEEKNTGVDEATVIEKIKSFIAKIIAMQEEAKEEMEESADNSKNENSSKDEKIKQDKKVEEKKTPDYLVEYYDLPYRYNETTVKILAQTPKRLFVYWDIADNDREKYINAFGSDFFYKTYPVLLLYNEDKKYVKEIAINDFANSWYIDIDDPKTKYTIQLGRKFIEQPQIIDMAKISENNIILRTDYLPIASSNTLEAPNDHVLLENLPKFIIFRNVKTNQEVAVELNKFKDSLGDNFNVGEFYEEHYKDEISEGMFDMANPSSKLSSSSFK